MECVVDLLSPHQVLKHFLDAYFHELGYNYKVLNEVRFVASNTLEGELQQRTLSLKASVGANVFLMFEDADKNRVGNGDYEKRTYRIGISIETLHGEYVIKEIVRRISSFCTNYRDGSLFRGFNANEWTNDISPIKDYRELDRITGSHRRKFWGLLKYRIQEFIRTDLGVSAELLRKELNLTPDDDLSYHLVHNSILQMQDIRDPGDFQESDIDEDKARLRYKIDLYIDELFFLKAEDRFDDDA